MTNEERFFSRTNGRCRARVFDASDLASFKEALLYAAIASIEKRPFYCEDNAGGITNNYGYATTTARWGVYTTPEGAVIAIADRVKVFGRSAPCVFHGGERSYFKWFREKGESNGRTEDRAVAGVTA